MAIKQISVFVENKPGRLADITGFLADGGISIRAFFNCRYNGFRHFETYCVGYR